MPDPQYTVEKRARALPSAIMSLMRQSGLMRLDPTPENADAYRGARQGDAPQGTDPISRAATRAMSIMGLYPFPDETRAQYQDAVFGPPSQWFPTAGLVRRATVGAPKDVNLPDPMAGRVVGTFGTTDPKTGAIVGRAVRGGDPMDPRWQTFNRERR